MKKLIILLFIPLVSFGQDYKNYRGVEMCLAIQQSYGFASDTDAEDALEMIMNVSGLNKNFVLQPCEDINNALAIRFNNERYIIYDPEFMSNIDGRARWRNLTVLAHEVAHHLNNHPVEVRISQNVDRSTYEKRKIQELEADEFAGFIMYKLGAPIDEVIKAVSSISFDGDDTYRTHPNREKRINAIKNGYKRAGFKEKFSWLDWEVPEFFRKIKKIFFDESEKKVEEPEYKKEEKEKVNFKYSIEKLYPLANWLNDRTYSYNKLKLELNKREEKASKKPYSSASRANVAEFKLYLGDFQGAIVDMNKAFALANKPSDDSSYGAINYELSKRAKIKYMLSDFQGALNDINLYSKNFGESTFTFFWRGVFQLALNDLNNACENLNKAININSGNKKYREKIQNESNYLLRKFCYN